MVGAGAYAPVMPVSAAEPVPGQAVADIQRARVEIYCGHGWQAVAVIRAASQQLRDSTARVSGETFAALDEAAWLARHDQYARAEQALDTALVGIASPGAAA
jgi:hypothetical protein